MTFKGIVTTGSTVKARFSSDTGNEGSALLLMDVGSGGTDGDQAIIAPGGSDTVSLDATDEGWLRVFVDVSGNEDTGTLEVSVDGSTQDSETVSGDTTWTYSVQ